MRLLQEEDAKTHPTRRRMYQLVELQQQREQIFDRKQLFQDKMKEIFDRRTKIDDFQIGDVVLQWDVPCKEKGKNGKFDHLWKVLYNISTFRGKNAYVLEEMEGGLVSGTPQTLLFVKEFSPIVIVYTISFCFKT